MIMKSSFVICLSSVALLLSAFGQDPTISPAAPVPPTAPIATTPSAVATPSTPLPSPAVSPTASKTEDLEHRINRKVKRHLNINIGDDPEREGDPKRTHHISHDGDLEDLGSLAAIPIVAIIFGTLSLFGAPVLVVAAIMFFSYLRSRSVHRTVRMMVEKGQPVPPELFAPPKAVRARSDMRRGVVLMMVGIGVMVFFGAVNDWEGGAWSLGIIPFLIGAGHLLVWKLEGNQPVLQNTSTDNPPRTS